MKNVLLLTIVASIVCHSQVSADNWAHWRGPAGNGVAAAANPPTTWSDTENVKWKVAIPGKGSGSPVIWENQVFVVTAVPEGSSGGRLPQLNFKLLSFNRANGEKLWEQTAIVATPHQETHSTNGFASGSPCTDGQHVYAFFGSRGLHCYTMDGQLVWQRNDFGKMDTRNNFGEGASPTIVDDKILVPWDHEGSSFLYALDKTTGKDIWKTARDEPTCWATPLVVQHNGQKQVVMNGQTSARCYDLESGKELWRCGGQTQRPVASAVSVGDMVYIGSGFRGNFMGAFRLGGSGNIENSPNVAWTIDRDCPDIASPLLSRGRLYFHKGKSGQFTCVDAKTGKPFYSAERIPGIKSTYASPIAAGGKVYITGRSGTTTVIEEADTLKVLATNSVGETVDATPAPVDNELFIRGEQHLFCIAE
ncbi:PQQ-binding-like beta-propeller repeat protein [Planctomycetes bacterium K23_9]|uniref:Outer membrane biogenesis protein BamB n=1 Tax=Stieleria marina TaxID=1930275 RepID=A0A517NQP3_9BACT|nr:outer membrane biogenesis protein BamB [Planctomycetes bacterium K23_9]